MEKKNKGGDEEVNEDAIADAEEGGAKEPNHSGSSASQVKLVC
jgi:hypothetical protein